MLPATDDELVGVPFGGLLGNSVAVRALNQFVADPYTVYTTHTVAGLAGATPPRVRDALTNLAAVGFLLKDSTNPRRPLYRANPESKRLIALTLLSYAVLDDHFSTSHFDTAILDYLAGEYRPRTGFNVITWPTVAVTGESTTAVALIGTAPMRPTSSNSGLVFATGSTKADRPLSLPLPASPGPT